MNILLLAALIIAGIAAIQERSLLAAAISLLAAGHLWNADL